MVLEAEDFNMAKETAISLIKGFGIIAAFAVTLTTTVFLGGLRIGKTEQVVETTREITTKNYDTILATQKIHNEKIGTIQRDQAYQKGVIETKLTGLEKSVDEIKRIVMQWESIDE